MKCRECEKLAVFETLCREHFLTDFLSRIKETISRHNLFKKDDLIYVAVSGGKDSLVLLQVLKTIGYNLHAICIDEGISNYREHKIQAMKTLCKSMNIDYEIFSFKGEFGVTLDSVLKKSDKLPCTICGILRRFVLNKYANGQIIATGHNLDDEAQSAMMNLLKNNLEMLVRLGPSTQNKNKFARRVKPFYFIREQEIMAYSILEKIHSPFVECPYAVTSYRFNVRNWLNRIEMGSPGTKLNIIESFLSIKGNLPESSDMRSCEICGSNSSHSKCKTCRIINEICRT